MNGKSGGKIVNMVLTALSIFVLLLWGRKYFGLGGPAARRAGAVRLSGTFLGSWSGTFWISIIAVCCAYLLWRGLSFLFWHKYFKDR